MTAKPPPQLARKLGKTPVCVFCQSFGLRGPAAIPFISLDACSDSVAKFFRAFLWGTAQLSRDMLQNGVSHGCACVKPSTKGGVSHHFGEC